MAKFSSQFKDNKGFTLMEVVVASALLGVIAIAVISLTKMQSNIQVKSTNDNDLAQLRSEIIALLANPAHCNANFAGITASTPQPSSISQCPTTTSGSCNTLNAGTPKTWSSTNTRVSITGIQRSFETLTSTTDIVTTGSIRVTFQIKDTNSVIKTVTQTFTAPVIYNGPTSTVKGCPKSWSSTLVY